MTLRSHVMQGFLKHFNQSEFIILKGMYSHIKALVASCQSYLEVSAQKRAGLAELQKMPIANRPCITLHLDNSGLYPQTFRGNEFIVAYVDSF